jgi:putative spermidine/putrescine transport system ATP-binding protein
VAYLELDNVSKSYGAVPAVRSVSLAIERGELVSFLGPSGCGKTTTLRLIAGLELPTAGTICIAGDDVTHLPTNRRNVGLVFQNYALFPNMTVADNVAFGLRIARRPDEEIRQRVREMLALIKLESFGPRYPHQLSGGQQQRVALARALAVRPRVLLLDEPLSALDARIRVDLREEIRAIQRALQITTIYVTHDQEEALSLSDRVAVMNDGRAEQVGPPAEIYHHPATAFVAAFVGTLNRLDATVRQPEQGRLAVADQEIFAASPLAAELAGRSVQLGLRPESLALNGAGTAHASPNGEDGSEGANRLRGKVEAVTFLGSVLRVELGLGDATLLVDTLNQPGRLPPRIGETAEVTFPREAVLVLDGPAGRQSGSATDQLPFASR